MGYAYPETFWTRITKCIWFIIIIIIIIIIVQAKEKI